MVRSVVDSPSDFSVSVSDADEDGDQVVTAKDGSASPSPVQDVQGVVMSSQRMLGRKSEGQARVSRYSPALVLVFGDCRAMQGRDRRGKGMGGS
jgi:hypothetical protein